MGDTMKICGFVLNGSVKSLVVCCVAFLGNQLVQAGRMLKRARIAALPLLGLSSVLGLVGTSQAATGYSGGIPWQTGDIVVCFGTSGGFGGACNVLRIVNGTAILLDEFTDNLGGDTFGVAISNSLHVVATDDAGGSKVVVYSVPSLNVNVSPATPLAHTPVRYLPDPEPYYDTSANGGAMVKAVAINNAGNIFVLNSTSNTGNPNIVEIGPGPSQTAVATVSLSSCPGALTQATSMDLSAAADASGNSKYAYVTSGGTIQQVTLATGACTTFANFGPNVTLYGIKDIPPGALANVSYCTGTTACPADEAILVVAIGNTDFGVTSPGDPDAVNICTNQTLSSSPAVSCALLLDTSSSDPGLKTPLWHPATLYGPPSVSTTILDPDLNIQVVVTSGTSGSDEPPFSETGGTVIDNAVKWTDISQPAWKMNNGYTVGALPAPNVAAVASTYFVDPNGNLQTVTTAGTSGPTEPGVSPNPVSWSIASLGTTIDGLQWQDQGAWQAGHVFLLGSAVGDAAGHPHTVFTAGTSGSSLPTWNDGGGTTDDNAVTWTNQGPVVAYSAGHPYGLGTYVTPNGHAQMVFEPGTSGSTTPSFSITGGKTMDGGVTWTDQGQEFWHPSFAFAAGAVIVDPAGHVQQVTTAGTSGTTQPIFNDAGSTTADNTVVWTDEGKLTWASSFNYAGNNAANTYVVDGATHVQQATTAGVSGPAAPTFNDGGTTTDATVTWTDQGQRFWYPSFAFAVSAIIVDTAGHVQQVTTAGTSGPTQPTFNDAGGSATDGLQWTDQGVPGTWAPSTYYALNAVILDGAGHVQQVVTAGTSGGPNPPTFNDSGSTTMDGTVLWQDRGTPGTWTASTVYALNAVITASGHVQQATSAGTSGGSAPAFSTIGLTVNDNTVIWTDQGLLSGNAQFTWQATSPYSLNAQIIDPANHVQKVTMAGTSGGSEPTFNDGGVVYDGLVWQDIGPVVAWTPSTQFPLGTLSVDTNSFLEEVTTAGISTTPSHPMWNVNVAGTTVDGLQWTDQGSSVWAAGHQYFTIGTLISDAATHAQKVTEAGTSGAHATDI